VAATWILNMLNRFIQHGLAVQGRYLQIHTPLADRPGELLRLLRLIAEPNVNVLDMEDHRTGPRPPIQQVEVMLTLETRDRAPCAVLLERLREEGFGVAETRLLCDLTGAGEMR
jgi:threonine dehydratase